VHCRCVAFQRELVFLFSSFLPHVVRASYRLLSYPPASSAEVSGHPSLQRSSCSPFAQTREAVRCCSGRQTLRQAGRQRCGWRAGQARAPSGDGGATAAVAGGKMPGCTGGAAAAGVAASTRPPV